MNDLRTAARQALAHVQAFKRRWMAVPPFGNKVNKATREAVTLAHVPVLQLEEALRAALEQPEPDAIEQALAHAEAFSRGHDAGWQSAIAHRAALEQPEQAEPVAWVENDGDIVWCDKARATGRNLYTHPPRRETEQPEQEPVANNPDPYHLSRILHELAGSASMCWEHVDRAGVFQSTQAADVVAAAIAEIRQRMKDAPPRREVEQAEPVVWGVDWGSHGDRSCCTIIKQHTDGTREVVAVEYAPSYTHPPRREWRGLSQEEIDRWTPEIHPVILAVEAALKGRNHE